MGAQTWNDVKEDVGAACACAGVVLLAALAVAMIGWPEVLLDLVSL